MRNRGRIAYLIPTAGGHFPGETGNDPDPHRNPSPMPGPVIYSVFRGSRGHPPLISRDCLRDPTVDHEGGLRNFLLRYTGETVGRVKVTDDAILMDCDTPADYRVLRDRVAHSLPR